MLDTPPYVACIDLAGRRALVVGEGPIAREKVDGLTTCGATVDAIPARAYEPERLEGAFLVVVATEDMALARRIFDDAEARSMLVNVADVPDLCNFILPAIARAGPITVAVSTSGASPALAQRIRAEVAATLDDAHAELAAVLEGLRSWARETLPGYEARRDFFDSIVNGEPDPVELLRAGGRRQLDELVELRKRAAAGEEEGGRG
jgi:siroheme synthase-like protein